MFNSSLLSEDSTLKQLQPEMGRVQKGVEMLVLGNREPPTQVNLKVPNHEKA